MRTYKIIQKALVLLLVMSVSNIAFSDEIVVVVKADSALTSISHSDLRRIFLGKKSEFKNGTTAIPVNQYLSSESRVAFDADFLRKTPKQIKAYWSKQLFTGAGVPPKEVPGDLDVLQVIAQTEGMIGYIESSALNQSVKVLPVK